MYNEATYFYIKNWFRENYKSDVIYNPHNNFIMKNTVQEANWETVMQRNLISSYQTIRHHILEDTLIFELNSLV
jgi:hypothetical protein